MKVPSSSSVARACLALLAVAFAIAGAAGPNEAVHPRFVPVEIYLESPEPVAAWQFELADRAGAMQVVGIEGGGHEAFPRAPYYDREALARDDVSRIVVADYSLADGGALPRGRVPPRHPAPHARRRSRLRTPPGHGDPRPRAPPSPLPLPSRMSPQRFRREKHHD